MKSRKAMPFNQRSSTNKSKSFDKTEKSVDPVAKDTNKTRRKSTLLPLPNAVKKKSAPKKMKGK